MVSSLVFYQLMLIGSVPVTGTSPFFTAGYASKQRLLCVQKGNVPDIGTPLPATPEEIEAAGRLHHRLYQTLVTALDNEDLVVRAVVMASIEFVAEAITPVALAKETAEEVEAFLQQTMFLIWMAVHRNMQRHREQHQTP